MRLAVIAADTVEQVLADERTTERTGGSLQLRLLCCGRGWCGLSRRRLRRRGLLLRLRLLCCGRGWCSLSRRRLRRRGLLLRLRLLCCGRGQRGLIWAVFHV